MFQPQVKLFLPRRGEKLALSSIAERIWLARQMSRIDRDIRKFGWAIVPFQLPHDLAPRWLYTAGFEETLGHPEMIIFDTPPQVAFEEFGTAFESIVRDGQRLEDGVVWTEDEGPKAVVRAVHPERLKRFGWLALAQERHLRKKGTLEGFRALQLVLADLEGRLPWDAGHNEDARKWQPELYTERDEDED